MAHHQELTRLATGYASDGVHTTLDDLRTLAAAYIARRNTSILDAAAVGLAFDAIMSQPTFDISEITPEMASAWELAYPNVPIESLAGRSTEGLAGAISGWKGKLFEVEIEQRLNAGEWVGDLHLEAGQRAQIAASATQPGWDIQIIDEDGAVADAIQLKATESVSYVHEALDRYPDTPILATHEVASRLADNPSIMDSGIHNDALTSSVSDHVSDASSDALSDALIGAMPLSIIAITEGSKVWSGKKTVDQALASGGDRVAKGVVAGAVAATVSVVATPLVGTIAGFIARLALNDESPRNVVPAKNDYRPNIAQLQDSAGRFRDYVKSFEDRYPCEIKQARKSKPASLADEEELISLVDQPTRLTILRGAIPLSEWIREIITLDPRGMSTEALDQHIDDLRQVRASGMIDTAIPAKGFLEVIGRVFNSDHRQLRGGLDEAIKGAQLYKKSRTNRLTPAESEESQLLDVSPMERTSARYEREATKRIEKRLQERRRRNT